MPGSFSNSEKTLFEGRDKQSGAKHARAVAKLRLYEGSFEPIAENMGPNRAASMLGKGLHLADSTAEYDHVGIEDVNDGRKREPEVR